jgi:ABC-type sugar transport system ATPase subunit
MAGQTPRLRLRSITKSFGDNKVLHGIDLDVAPGEVVALVGENGAGKSTLVRIITGAYRPDGGEIQVSGEPVTLHDVHDGMRHGIHAIYQELRHNLFPQRSVAENIFMLDERRRFGRLVTRQSAMHKAAEELLASVGMSIDPGTRVGDLAVSEQQMVEVASAVSKQLSLLILDEPTAALDEQEAERLFEQIRRLQASGISIIYVSHRLEEVFELADRIVVLRDGRVSVEGEAEGLAEATVVRAMVGRPIEHFYPKERHTRAEVTLAVQHATKRGAFHDVSFEVHAGEIFGIGGALGSGRSSLLQALFGRIRMDSGTVELRGHRVTLTSPRRAIAAGIGYISEDRQRDGLCLNRSISDNVTLAKTRAFALPGGLMRKRRELAVTASVMEQLSIRAQSPADLVGQLSGGNQQKVLFGKWLVANPTLLLLEEPTRGVDVGAKVEVYRYLNQLTAQGLAVVLVSTDLPELCEMSDRVMVMRDGAVVAMLDDEVISQEDLLRYSLGGAA